MSTNRLLLLSLLFVGVSGSSLLLANAAEDIAKTFLISLDAALHSQDENKIGQLFSEDFFFGYTSSYDKKQTISTLLVAEKAGKLLMEYKSSEFTKQGAVAYTITLSGFGEPVEAKFILHKENGEYVLLRGGALSYPKRHFVASGADIVAKTFLDAFKQDIFDGDKDKIGKRISENFQFHGCENEYNKQKLVGLLSSIPKGSKISMDFKSARFVNGDDIEYLVEAVGFSTSSIEAQFILHKENGQYVLIGGKVSTCPARRLTSSSHGMNPELYAYYFIEKANKYIGTRNRDLIADLFADDFVYRSCGYRLNKEKVVDILTSSGPTAPLIKYRSAQKYHDVSIKVGIDIHIRGYDRPVFVEISITRRDGKWIVLSGDMFRCTRNHQAGVVFRDPVEIVTEFLDSLTESISDRNGRQISNHFYRTFLFVGCTGNFTKGQVVKVLSSLPEGQKFEFNLLNAKFVSPGRIEYTVKVNGIGAALTDVYTLERLFGRYLLVSGRVIDCPPEFIF